MHMNFLGASKNCLLLIKYFFLYPREVNPLSPFVCYLHFNSVQCIEQALSLLKATKFAHWWFSGRFAFTCSVLNDV